MKKICLFFVLVSMILAPAVSMAQNKILRGDANVDGEVTIADVATLIDYLLTDDWPDEPQTEVFTVNGVSFKMVAVKGGTFMMGVPDEEEIMDLTFSKPAHQVSVASFAIGETEVTQALWLAVMGNNPSYFTSANGYTDNLNRPVENVSWTDCLTFISKLNELTGRNFRLPWEAEWEFAARGGNMSQRFKYAGSNKYNEVAWNYENSCAGGSSNPNYGTHSVATKLPNELGLYDMSGNVYEVCGDYYVEYTSEPQVYPTGPTNSPNSYGFRVNRGGCWDQLPVHSRVEYRDKFRLSANKSVGLRLVL